MSTETGKNPEPSVITDEKLDTYLSLGGGYARAARAIQDLDPAARSLAWSDGSIRANLSPGWLFADAVAESARDLRAGRPLKHIEINRQIIEQDPHGFRAAALASGHHDS